MSERWSTHIIRYMVEHLSEPTCLDHMAEFTGITKYHLVRIFGHDTGMSPMEFFWRLRTLVAAELISVAPRWSLTAISTTCGFTSSAHFARRFRSEFAVSPSQFKRQTMQTHSQNQTARSESIRLIADPTIIVLKALTQMTSKHSASEKLADAVRDLSRYHLPHNELGQHP